MRDQALDAPFHSIDFSGPAKDRDHIGEGDAQGDWLVTAGRLLDRLMRNLAATLRPATQPQGPRQDNKRAHAMVVAETVDTNQAPGRGQLETSLAMALCCRLVAGKMMRHAEYPFGHDDAVRVADRIGDGGAAFGECQRGTEIPRPNEKEIEAGEQAKLMVPVPQCLGKVEAPYEGGPHLVRVAADEHRGNGQPFAQRQFALRIAIDFR